MRQLLLAVAVLLPLTSVAQVAGGPLPPATATAQPVSLLPAPAQPAGPASSWELFAKAGAVFPSDEHLTGFENGPALETGGRFALSPNFALEGGVGYWATTMRFSSDDPVAGTFEYEETLRAVPLLASLRLSGRVGDVEFFGLLGGGMYLLWLNGSVSSSLQGTSTGSDDSIALGVHAGGGVAAYVTPRMTLGVEARYLFSEAEFGGDTGRLDSAFLTATVGYRL
jgi:opacity protein-like surface antigen